MTPEEFVAAWRSATLECEALAAQLERERKRCGVLMEKNSALWLEMSKLPGGLDAARRLG